ncbi:MAG: Hpt domain-containing protein, partial [Xenococcus sp. (in: cyanobacteria)]
MNDPEQQIRRQFLDEALEYIDNLESSLLGITNQALSYSQLDQIRRAAHSLKGGAALMSYPKLSDLAHKIEDCFKSLKKGWICPDETIEGLSLQCVDYLRHCVVQHQQGKENIDENWLSQEVIPLFEQLEQLISFYQPSDSVEGEEPPQETDMRVLMFETEVEGCLERLEHIAASEDNTCLREEFQETAQKLGGLGEMLELPAFTSLCGEIEQVVTEANEETLLGIVQQSLDAWRRSQAIIMIRQFDALPDTLREDPNLDEVPTELSFEDDLISEADSLDFLASLDTFNLEEENLEIEVNEIKVAEENLEIELNEVEVAEENLEIELNEIKVPEESLEIELNEIKVAEEPLIEQPTP